MAIISLSELPIIPIVFTRSQSSLNGSHCNPSCRTQQILTSHRRQTARYYPRTRFLIMPSRLADVSQISAAPRQTTFPILESGHRCECFLEPRMFMAAEILRTILPCFCVKFVSPVIDQSQSNSMIRSVLSCISFFLYKKKIHFLTAYVHSIVPRAAGAMTSSFENHRSSIQSTVLQVALVVSPSMGLSRPYSTTC